MGRWCYFYRLYSSSRSFRSFSSDDFHHICLALFPLILLSLQPHAETHRVDVFSISFLSLCALISLSLLLVHFLSGTPSFGAGTFSAELCSLW